MTNTSAAERVAALREEHARLGDNVTGLSDVEVLLNEVDRSWKESRRHENNYSNLLQDRAKSERATRTAARRTAVEDRRAWAGIYLNSLVSQSAREINALIHRAAELPDGRVPVELTRELKAAADQAGHLPLGAFGGGESQLADVRRQNQEIQLVEKQRDEIWRLREFVAEQGQRLHAEHGQKGSGENGWRCECPGCELIRAMDDVPAEQAGAPIPSAATAA